MSVSATAVRRSIYGKLAGDTTLNSLLATPPTGFAKSIFYEQAPQAASFPYVIFDKSAGTPEYAMATTAAFKTDVWLVKGVDRNTTADRVEAIRDRLETLLSDADLSISGAATVWLRPQSDVDYPEDSEGVRYLHSGQLFRLTVEPS